MGRWRYRPDDNETERSAGYFDGAWNRVKKCKGCGRPYLGDMDIKIKNDVFKVTVMLQQKEIK